ncbi:cytochrome c oxidase subunit 3 [Chelativorans sp. SCAU2101]|uniref:Cytochrome c oxidase subunit 3 n=1 Tax=Chelativorans petroleitrophicus TaxID=2975484 RepID=A0A9X2X7Y4_9HYPH|nr:cytochrome c oxidase subunit 3 [Chelativorans petroleitrophicus]MCT8989756.1 cytochrome c oxidase subunit 3 [Chelativorans petroleitrophicus]
MSVILVLIVVVAGFSFWWLLQQRVLAKPWLEYGVHTALPETDVSHMPTAKIGLGIFLAVVASLFALFASAYFMRMEYADWQSPPLPRILWFNTVILVLASLALHFAVRAVREGRPDVARLALAAAGLASLLFLAGQLTAWRELTAGGYFLDTNPANGFFYLMTGIHGLHILGGLAALARATVRAWTEERIDERLRLGVELCATYWHFLLLVWLGVFVLLAGWAGDLVALCRQLLT